MLPATINTSTGLKVVDIMCLATPVKSSNVTVLAKDVPFNINIISLPYAGKDCLIAIGNLILKNVFILLNPKPSAASTIPLLIVSKADLKISEEYAPVFKVKASIAHEYGSFRKTQRKDSLIYSS